MLIGEVQERFQCGSIRSLAVAARSATGNSSDTTSRDRKGAGAARREASVMAKAVVLLSGGLDSTTALAVARSQGFACYALSVDYGQRHRVELARAATVAKSLG